MTQPDSSSASAPASSSSAHVASVAKDGASATGEIFNPFTVASKTAPVTQPATAASSTSASNDLKAQTPNSPSKLAATAASTNKDGATKTASPLKPAATAPESKPHPAPAAATAAATSSTDASASAGESADADAEAVEAESTAEYEPVVKLEVIATKSGEEDEEELYKQRSALYRFDSTANEWKERGKGDVKLLQHKNGGKIRILLRQDKTLKVCLNHLVHADIQLKPNAGSDRSWTWRCEDFSGLEPETQTFAIRFKDAKIAKEFQAKFEEVQKLNAAQ